MPSPITRLLTLVLAAVAATCHAAEPLRWKFEPGETFTYEMTQKMDSTTVAGAAGAIQSGIEQTMDITWHIDEMTPEGNAKMRQKIENIKLTMNMPGGQVTTFDSTSDEPPQGFAAMLAPLYKAMTEGDFEITMTPRGEILEAEAPPKLAEAIKNIPGAAAMGDLGTPDGIKQMLMHSSATLPEGELHSGETWEATVEMKSPVGTQEVATTYEYAGTKDVDGQSLEVIKLTPTIKNVADPNAQIQMTIGDQSSEGEILFNRQAGRMQSSHLKQNLTMEVQVQGQKIETVMDQTVDMKLKQSQTGE